MSLDLETVHTDMLAAIDDRYQKTPGFPAYDFTRAFALAILELADDIDIAELHLDVDNLEGPDLDRFITQHRGLTRRYATYAEATLRVVSGSGTVISGDLFSTESGVEFECITDTDVTEGDTFEVRAAVGGSSGNVDAETITFMPVTIAGIGAVINDAAAEGGYDEETDDEYRERYYNDLQNPSNGSNQQAYVNWATSIAGVGRAKIFPQAYGDNTVEVCIIDTDMEPADPGLIADVQAAIDPNENGDGAGLAPIGAAATVTTATSLSVPVAATLYLAEGTTLNEAKTEIEVLLTAYLRSIAFVQSYVSYAQVGKIIATADGVLDYASLRIDGDVANMDIASHETPVLGTCTFTAG